MRLLVVLVLALSGCCVADKALETAEAAAAGSERYTLLASQALAGTIGANMGLEPVSPEDLKKAPPNVRLLISRLFEALHSNRFAWHSLLFQLNKGPDPATLKLEVIELRDRDGILLEDR